MIINRKITRRIQENCYMKTAEEFNEFKEEFETLNEKLSARTG